MSDVCHLKDNIRKKKINDKEVHDNKIFNYFGNSINASYLSFEIKIRSMSWYGSVSVIIIIMLLIIY